MGRLTQTNSANIKQFDVMQQMHMHGQQQDDERVILLTGDINEISISMATAGILTLAQRDRIKPIYLVINTYGGSIDEMYCLYDVMKYVTTPIYTIGLGKIMSAGVLLLAAGAKGHRSIGKNARVMMHPISSGAFGNVFEMMNYAAEAKRLQEQYELSIVNETKILHSDVSDMMKQGIDKYVDANDAVRFGIVDHIIGG
jgi:ATP-dependent Clp protease protease subunit